MYDSVFQRKVILLISHDKEEGSYGLILNQPTNFDIQRCVKGGNLPVEVLKAFGTVAVRAGGPVREGDIFSASWGSGIASGSGIRSYELDGGVWVLRCRYHVSRWFTMWRRWEG